MSITHKLRTLLWNTGYDITRFTPASHPIAWRRQLLANHRIDVVLDVGANSGQFAQRLRSDLRYTKRILSFEPQTAAFQLLQANASGDPAWEVFNYALGDLAVATDINIAGNSYSSSILEMLPAHLESAPQSRYVGKESVTVKPLDSVFGSLCPSGSRVYLKIDTQGFESRVLKGAEHALSQIEIVQMEISVVPMYAGEMLFPDLCMLMNRKGYSLVFLEHEFFDPKSGRLLQIDGTFRRL